MPFLRKQRDGIALGGQQAQRLRQLRLVSENHIHAKHLQPLGTTQSPASASQNQAGSPAYGHSARASRTVEAIIESRTTNGESDMPPSKATRLRETIRGARGGIHTERSEESRPRTTLPLTHTANGSTTKGAAKTTHGIFHQRIAVVRRPHGGGMDASQRRKLTREELEWIEKQLQCTQRVCLLERECATWWQSFYASAAGTSMTVAGAEEAWITTHAIQKQVDESDQRRHQDTQELQQRLHALRQQADHVIHMVYQMRDGVDFISDLQDAMDRFEQDLGHFRVTQREKFDAYVLEEKLLERDLDTFLDKIETWEQRELEKKHAPKIVAKPKNKIDGFRHQAATCDEPEVSNGRQVDEELQEAKGRGEIDLVKRVRLLNQQILESGGLKGGWDGREHGVFASALLKCGLSDEILLAHDVANGGEKNQDDGEPSIPNEADFETRVARCIRKCVQTIVTKSENAVRNHFDWYLSHLRLLQEKKEAIQQWKQKKETERQQLIRQGLHQVGPDATLPENGQARDGVDSRGNQSSKPKTTKRNEEIEAKERVRKLRELDAWRERKERRVAQEQELEREKRALQEAREAKKQQELLEKKQQLLLYKLQKEQDTAMLQRNRSPHGGDKSPPGSQSPGATNEELLARSRKAIEQAKAKRAKLQALEERRLKQQELPARPKSTTKPKTSGSGSAASPTDSEGSPTTLLKPTKAFEARHLTKLELQRKQKERSTQGAHDTYFPGAGVISDVKIKSFGHIAIAPRAVPSWRRNM